ncbi:hypothetical protein A3A93_00385 [Candidatus Roizmanbacteria bacterium RIFCSPLOWO2_01_FULL_38_12]|uniref:S-adenosyl-l-methionine hydroxide adenosyltransferase C-terminal domain-containing protein n=1 Tax=Candidatus Roizmanbacteria bacterium RIFCSPLOWO2_01_FULL_38_12 TaxID=1802061 RepID=A0A1F7J0R9_9BACT|nr:MAG: hypothetical protein A3F59_05520 [Candidatus Roizmanbacteria bacterium RIFCSPHIGHO2_12_FULL_38_13]OGK49211.1 MAG: hypothetical protein A3A93_00385 [Candidatus Roizmanbacteria bacterium RIFCSPLOWO2_01_FULL_38_12]
MKKLIIVADWGDDALATQEVRSAIEGFLKSSPAKTTPNINIIPSSPSTIHTSFLIGQTVEIEERYGEPLDTIIFQNTDPMSEHTEESGGVGSQLLILRLKSGIYVIGPNAGYVFSFVRPKIEEAFYYPRLEMSGQFRSRDVFAKVAAYFMDVLQDDLDLDEIHPNQIPQLDGYFVGHMDNFGNIKTTVPESVLKGKYSLGDELSITINGVTQKMKYVKSLFDGGPNSLIIYPGSSGKIDDPYLEISVCTDFSAKNPKTGKDLFNSPRPGMKIEIQI